ncbi:MAG TPA: glutathione S-transferase family protein [Candidatus Binatia bacterium]|nr:glutathione S-transferase family protein [Candidatus Binatia bacterium]
MTTGPGPVSTFRFFGTERSYFSGKARPAFRAKRVFFEEILPTRSAMAEIKRRTGLQFLPTVVTPEDETWQDTSDIIDALDRRFPEPRLVPETAVQRVVAYLVELYADEFLILPAMHYRWSTPEGEREARAAFAASSGDPRTANLFADRMRGTLPLLGIVPGTIPAIEAHYHELVDRLEAVFADQGFLLGDQMSLADCALMGPFYGHLYLDPVPGPALRIRAPRVAHWIEHMNQPDPSSFAGFRARDELHPAVRDVLALVGRDAGPVVLDTVRDFERWASEQPAGEIEPPRGIGVHETRLRGVALTRYTSPYTLWMLQRPIDAYRALDEAGRRAVDRVLDGTGCGDLLRFEPRYRVEKRSFRLVCRPA